VNDPPFKVTVASNAKTAMLLPPPSPPPPPFPPPPPHPFTPEPPVHGIVDVVHGELLVHCV
jgi:hypothetical protein